MTGKDDLERMRARLLAGAKSAPTSRLTRALRAGRNAAGIVARTATSRVLGGDINVDAIESIVERMGELKGISMKAGQIIGTLDSVVPEEIRRVLATLQTAAARTSFPEVEAILRRSFGDRAETLLAGMKPEPVAVASIGQVHRAVVDGLEVAVKVRHPTAEDVLRADFATAGAGARFATLLMPGAGDTVRLTIDEVRTAILEECDFTLEAERQRLFGRIFAADDVVAIPAVVDAWCSREVLTTAWTPGASIDAFLAANPSQAARDRLGVALFRFYVGTLYRHGLFHADPHPGNYAFPEDGRLVVYDFGCVRSFSPESVAAYARLLAAVRDDDAPAIRDALVILGGRVPDDEATTLVLRRLLRGFFGPLTTPGPCRVEAGLTATMREVMRDKITVARLRLPAPLIFLFRIRFGLYSVLSRIGAVADWAAIESAWAADMSS
jgi:predicted unusual protein kinase regulating ubiquinone biosynthesis (AarF/ABC1/UbiB family)